MSAAEDFYARLRVSPQSEGAVIRAAYRGLMRRYHPDVNASDDAVAEAKAINEAYACLRDPDKRAAYDWQRSATSRAPQSPYTRRRHQRPRPEWAGPTPPAEPPLPWFQPTWGNAVGLAIAAVVTAITFTITSAIPPVQPAAAKAETEVQMRLAPIADQAGRGCREERINARRTRGPACLR